MILLSRVTISAAVLAGLFFHSQLHYRGGFYANLAPIASEAGEQHPVIHRAIRALEAAKAYMAGAPHDFCGHRVAALAESNLALNELGLAVICDKRRDKSARSATAKPASSSLGRAAALAPERHPLIREAVNALQAARRDLDNASRDYCGHRALALETVNRALTQLKLALDCDQN
jgi:hypothetical protein